MSDRERWIIYPLLFLALGVAFRDKYGPVKKVWTHNLVVVNDDEQPIVDISASKNGDGVVRVGRSDHKLDLVLGNEGSSSSLFAERRTTLGTIRYDLLGNLRNDLPSGWERWLLGLPRSIPPQRETHVPPDPATSRPAEGGK